MNPDLQQLQVILLGLGYLAVQPLAGELDEPTRAALRAFQRTHRLPVTGEPDDETKQLASRAAAAHEYVVFGHVFDAEGERPLQDAVIGVEDRDLGPPPWQALGQGRVEADGFFALLFNLDQFAGGDRVAGDKDPVPDLLFSLGMHGMGVQSLQIWRMPSQEPLTDDDLELGLQARRAEEVKIVATLNGRRHLQGESEYERLLAAFNKVWPERSPGSLDEERQREFTFVARELEAPIGNIEALANSFKWAADVFRQDLGPQVLYALARSRKRLTTLQALGTASAGDLKSGIFQSIEDRIIPALSGAQIAAAIELIRSAGPTLAGTQPDVVGLPSFAERIGAGVADEAARSALLETFAEHRANSEEFWRQLRGKPEFAAAGAVERAQFALQLDALTQSHVPLMNALQTQHGITSTRDLLKFGERKLRDVLAGDGIGIPVDVPGEDDPARTDHYVASVMGALQLALPTESVAMALRAMPADAFGGETVRSAVGTFFDHATSVQARDAGRGFDIRTVSLPGYVASHGDAMFAGVSAEDRASATHHIARAQRLFRVSTDPKVLSSLMSSDIRSARDIASMSAASFTARFQESIGPQQSMMTHNNAIAASASTVQMYVTINDLIRGATPNAVADGDPDGMRDALSKHMPDWQELFGAPELCACTHCRSVYSAAAYLVDVLQFLEGSAPNADGLTPLDILIGKSTGPITVMGRRPDLAHLKLTCENTETAIPYVDLVNEVLECLAMSWATVAETGAGIVADKAAIEAHDTGATTTEELKGSPQFILDDAYQTPDVAGARERLDRAPWPLPLPYDAPLDAVRGCLDYMGVPAARVMEIFNTSGNLARSRVESLRIAPREFAILTGANLDGTPAAELSSDDLYGFSAELLPRLEAGNTGVYVSALKQKLNSGGAGLPVAPNPATETFDAATTAAVNALQAANGFGATGVVAIGEWRILRAAEPSFSVQLLPSVRELLRRSGLQFEELVKLCEMRFLNPQREVFGILQRLKLPQAGLEAWIAGGLAGDPGADVIAELDTADVSLDAFKAWAEKHLQGETWTQAKASLVLESPIDTPCDLDRTRLRHWDEKQPALIAAEWHRLSRLIRLWRKLGWTVAELDRALIALGAEEITPDVISQLAFIQRMKTDLELGVDELSNLWALPDVVSSASFFAQRFLSKTALRNDAAFAPDWKGEVLLGTKVSEHVSALLSGLRLKAPHLDAIRAHALPPGSDDLSVASLGLVSRYAILSRALGMRPPEFITLLTLSGIDPFTAPGAHWDLERFVALWRGVQEADLSTAQLDYLFRGGADHLLAPDAAALDLELEELGKALAQLTVEYGLADDPHGDVTRARLGTVYPDADLVTRFIRMIDGSAVYSTALAAMPGDVVWPPAHAHRFAFDAAAGALIVHGALTEPERVALRGLSISGDFESAIDELAAAPRRALADFIASPAAISIVIPSPDAKLLDTTSFDADGKVDPAAVAAKFAHVLASILPALHDAARRTTIKQRLADTLGIGSNLVARLLETGSDGRTLLHAVGAPAEPMIADFFDPLVVANAKRSRLRLHKAALIVGTLSLTEAELGLLTVFDFDRLPDSEPAPYDPAVYASYRDLAEYVRLRKALPKGATPLAAVFGAADLNGALASLSKASGVAVGRLQELVAPDAFAMDQAGVKSVAGIGRLLKSVQTLDRLGVAPAQAFAWASKPVTAETADDARRAARAPFSEAEWRGVANTLNDQLREARRDMLVAYLVPRLGCHTRAELYEQLLIDVDMGACMLTSRIKQAAASVQLFVQRCMMNLEPQVLPSAIDPDQWRWMKRYRVWEANRKVFLYPENWILPELRDDKTPFFKDLESALLQNDVTDANVERALLDYLEKLNGVAKLHLCGMFVQSDFELSEKMKQVVHVFARTLNAPFAHHYRRYELDSNDVAVWTPWEHVPVDVRGDQIAPVVFNRRLYLFWYVISMKAEEPPANTSKPSAPQKYEELQVAWSEYSNGKWSPKLISDPEVALRLSLSGSRRFEASVSGESLSVVYTASDIRGVCYKPGFTIGGASTPCRTVQEYLEKAEGQFTFDNCHGTLQLSHSGWTVSHVTGYGVTPSDVQPLGNGVVEPIPTLTQSTTGASILEERHHHSGSDYFGYEDPSRVYFAHVEPKWSGKGTLSPYANGFALTPDLNKYREMLVKPYEVQTDLGTPYFQQVSKAAAVTSNSWLSATATLGTQQLKLMAPVTVASAAAAADAVSAGTFGKKATSIVASDYSKYARAADAEVRYQIFYHPFTCEFMAGLRRYGVPGLLNLENQQLKLINTFDRRYKPTKAVVRPYPVEFVDFGRVGTTSTYNVTAYSVYNWELFFHAPLMIAARLSADQRFEEAMRWYHYVFNPTDGRGSYWKVLPFRTTPKETIEQLLTNLNAGQPETVRQVAEWRDHPFQPHLIARMRLIAYQKNVVMKYIDNLLAWGDQLFRQDTIETINEATQLYVMAATLLGPKPQRIPSRGQAAPTTFAQLRGKLDAFSNAMTSFENVFPYYSPSSTVTAPDAVGLLGVGRSLYFCIPQNEQLLGYWDTVADRLFKIRHCMNIEGVVRQLPLFEPPIDPALLVRAAARGVDLGSVLSDLNSAAPFYRFTHMLQKALEVCAELKNIGSQFLHAFEKRDAEHLALLRQGHERSVLAMARVTREKLVEEAQAGLDALRALRRGQVVKYQHFLGLLGAEAGPEPKEGVDIPVVSARRKSSASGGAHLIDEETGELDSSHSARDWQVRVATTEMLAGALHYIPNFVIKAAPFCVGTQIEIGGRHIGPAMGAIARFQKNKGEQDAYDASHFRRMAEHVRREQQWVLEANGAGQEIMHIDKQLIGLDIRVAMAKHELRAHEKQVENAAATEEFLRTKFTNQELFAWMQGQTSELFLRTYQLAYDLAKKAQRSFDLELGQRGSDFVQFGAWDGLRRGLLSGERLALQLRQLEGAWHQRNKRELEITRHVSLLQIDPEAFIRLKATGTCEFEVPEAVFDLDFPGHYFRRLRTVAVSIPAVVGPYTSVGATLTLLSHRVRTDGNAAVAYPEKQGEDETRFRRDFIPLQSVAISGGSNDSGVFELSLRDERYLPFEGAGAISRWRLHFPQCDPNDASKRFAQFDYDSISDVVMHLRYTARDGGDALAEKVRDSLRQTLNQLQTLQDKQGLFRLFSVRHEFPDVWLHTRAAGEPLTLQIKKERLPYFVQGRKVTVQSAFLLDGPGKVTELAEPDLVPAQNLWNVQVTPAVTATDALVLIIYTIG